MRIRLSGYCYCWEMRRRFGANARPIGKTGTVLDLDGPYGNDHPVHVRFDAPEHAAPAADSDYFAFDEVVRVDEETPQ